MQEATYTALDYRALICRDKGTQDIYNLNQPIAIRHCPLIVNLGSAFVK